MDVKKARESIEQLINDLQSQYIPTQELVKRLESLAPLLRRRPEKRRAKARKRNRPLPEYKTIKYLVDNNPDLTLAEIAHRFQVNPGRISEILHK